MSDTWTNGPLDVTPTPAITSSAMGLAERQALLVDLQKARGNRICVVYVTSTRTGHEIQMADDVIRILADHLEDHRETAAKEGIDLFIHSNGGSGTVPWRMVNLIREHTSKFAVLVPHRAFSAATLVALGADEIVMHRMGNLGPIDPSVVNPFNPANPQAPGQLAPISVEDVSAYFKLVKEEVGIRHEDELIAALGALTEKIHPLALGNVQRSHNQSRMMARKLLQLRSKPTADHEILQLIETLKSNLFFHGHPINRKEARDDLKLPAVDPSSEVEALMWKLYVEYEAALKLREPFQPLHELEQVKAPEAPSGAITTQDVVKQIVELAKAGIGVGAIPEAQLVNIAVALVPHIKAGVQQPMRLSLKEVEGAYVESVGRTDVFKTDLTIYRATAVTPSGPQEMVKQEVTWQRWEKQS